MLRCKDLKSLPSLGRLRYLTGTRGLENPIRWIYTPEDAIRLQEAGCDGILVGEGLVQASDIAAKTRELSEVKKAVSQSA